MVEYNKIVSDVGVHLKSKGWTKKADTFYSQKYGNLGVLNFQRSGSSTASETLFTINLGVSSTALRKFEEDDLSRKPTVWDCHWRKRIGRLLPQNEDYWWRLNERTDKGKLIAEIIVVLDTVALPEIERYMSDTSLEVAWSNGAADGLTEFQRHVNLTSILKIYNKDNLPEAVQDMISFAKGKELESSAKSHIKELGFTYA